MKYALFAEVALAEDIPVHALKKGDVATIVEHIPAPPDAEAGYALEVFNTIGETFDVLLVKESQIEALRSDELWHIRSLAKVA